MTILVFIVVVTAIVVLAADAAVMLMQLGFSSLTLTNLGLLQNNLIYSSIYSTVWHIF